MKKMKILSLILCSVVVSVSLAGCGGGTAASNTTSGSANASSTMDKTPITFTIYSTDATTDMPFTDPVAKEITKLTGVTLKFEHAVAGDTQAVPLMIASGQYPDLIYAKGDTGKLVDAGALVKLNSYIDKEGNYLKALYGNQIKKLDYSTTDSSIYTVGTNGVTNSIFQPDGTMQIQMAALKDLGYPKINSLDEYEKAIKDYVAKYPTINGQKTIGLSLMASDWRWLIDVGNVAGMVAGIPNDGQFDVNDTTGKTTYKFEEPKVEQYFKWLNKMNAEGLLDPESFTQKEDTYKAKIASGRVVGLTDSNWDYSTAITQLKNAGMSDRAYAPLSVTLGSQYTDQTLKNYGFSGGWGVGITTSCKNPERAFQFLNWLASDQAQVLLNWGIEGKDYTVVNGKRVQTASFIQKKNTDPNVAVDTGVGEYVYPFPERGVGAIDPTGNSYSTTTLANIVSNYTADEKATLKAYGKTNWTEFFPSEKSLGAPPVHGQVWEYTIPSDSDAAIIEKKCDDYTQEAITKAILGSPANFDSAWATIESTLKSYQVAKLDADMTAMTKARIKAYK